MASLPVTCEKCKMDITSGRVVDALGKKWHPGCFLCSKCNGVIGADAHFVVLNNAVLCSECGEEAIKRDANTKCAVCSKVIPQEESIAQMAGLCWHWGCYNCSKCGVSLVQADDMFLNRERKLFCTKCYRRPCARCGEHISDEFLTVHNDRVHLACFTCARCMSILDPNQYFEMDDKQFCAACYAARKAESAKADSGIAKCAKCGQEAVCKWMLAGKRVCQICKLGGKNVAPKLDTEAIFQ